MRIIFIKLLLFCSLFSQTKLNHQKFIADSLFDKAYFFEAVTEYRRLQFFDKHSEYSFISNYKIGLCYKAGAKFDESINYFSKSLISANSKEEEFAAAEQMIRVNILRRTTSRAHQLLNELSHDTAYNEENIYYWRGWIYMFEDEWESAAEEFGKISPNHELKKLCVSVNNEKYSVTFAKIISLILPGSGQFYTGNYLSGIMSLGWNILWGYATINAFTEERIFDGIMVGDLLWLRFYRGNYQNAAKFAEEKNIQIINEAYRYLQNSYEGLKP